MERMLESLIQTKTMKGVRTVMNLTSLMMVTMKYPRTVMFLILWMMVMYAQPPITASKVKLNYRAMNYLAFLLYTYACFPYSSRIVGYPLNDT